MAAPKNARGNAGKGRPKGKPNRATRVLRALAQEYTEEAVETLIGIMRDVDGAPAAARLHAAETILAYGHGKPRQAVDLAADEQSEKPFTIVVLPDNGRG